MTADPVPAQMRARLAQLGPLKLEIRDDSRHHEGHAHKGSGGHYHVRIVAEAFRGLPTVARHRLIYGALGDLMQRDIHALAIEASAP